VTTNVGLSHPQVDVDFRDEAIEERIRHGKYQPPLPAKPLNAWAKISTTWPAGPPDGYLHVLVSLPSPLVQTSPTLINVVGECFIRLFVLAQDI
jgi:hypothetical protein